MGIDRVTLSFSNRPTLKIGGQQQDVNKFGTVTIGGNQYQGKQLDDNTYLVVTPAQNRAKGKGKYQLELVSAGGDSLRNWKVKLHGGKIAGMGLHGDYYKAKRPIPKNNTFTFDEKFANRFRREAESQASRDLRKIGFKFEDEDLYKYAKKNNLTPEHYSALTNKNTSFTLRQKILDEMLGKANSRNKSYPPSQPSISSNQGKTSVRHPKSSRNKSPLISAPDTNTDSDENIVERLLIRNEVAKITLNYKQQFGDNPVFNEPVPSQPRLKNLWNKLQDTIEVQNMIISGVIDADIAASGQKLLAEGKLQTWLEMIDKKQSAKMQQPSQNPQSVPSNPTTQATPNTNKSKPTRKTVSKQRPVPEKQGRVFLKDLPALYDRANTISKAALKKPTIGYVEQQHNSECAVHAINAALQGPVVNAAGLTAWKQTKSLEDSIRAPAYAHMSAREDVVKLIQDFKNKPTDPNVLQRLTGIDKSVDWKSVKKENVLKILEKHHNDLLTREIVSLSNLQMLHRIQTLDRKIRITKAKGGNTDQLFAERSLLANKLDSARPDNHADLDALDAKSGSEPQFVFSYLRQLHQSSQIPQQFQHAVVDFSGSYNATHHDDDVTISKSIPQVTGNRCIIGYQKPSQHYVAFTKIEGKWFKHDSLNPKKQEQTSPEQFMASLRHNGNEQITLSQAP